MILKFKKVGKWAPLCCTLNIEYVTIGPIGRVKFNDLSLNTKNNFEQRQSISLSIFSDMFFYT